jgi:hypothetical protein
MLDKHVYLYFLKVAGLDPAKVLKKMKVISTLIRTNKLSQKWIFSGGVFDKVVSFPIGLVPK